jgi:hypothetical protein
MADEKIATGGGTAIDGNVDAHRDFVGRDTTRSSNSNTVNFQADPNFLNQFYMLILQVQLDVNKLDGKFERQSNQLTDMKLDVMSLKADMMSIKQRVDNQQTQGDQRGVDIAGLKEQLGQVIRTTGAMRGEVEVITSKLSLRNRVELIIITAVSVVTGGWLIWQQVIK